MDSFEDFQFKPITEGLGFHKKNNAQQTKDANAENNSAELNLLDEGTRLNFSSPLPRTDDVLGSGRTNNAKHRNLSMIETTENFQNKNDKNHQPGNPSSQAVDDILKTLKKNRGLDFDDKSLNKKSPGLKNETLTSQSKMTAKDEYVPAQFNITSGILDGMLVVAASLICTIILLLITKVDLIANLAHPDQYFMIYVATFLMVAMVSLVYFVVNRIFIGCTPGEWAFDLRIGKPNEQNDLNFLVSLLIRTTVVILTGFVVLPIASVIKGKDFAGLISMARIYRKA